LSFEVWRIDYIVLARVVIQYVNVLCVWYETVIDVNLRCCDYSCRVRHRLRQIDLLDSKRSLNVNIFLRQFPQSLSTADIVNALLLSDPLQTDEVADGRRGCDAEMMSCLLKLAPDEDDDEVQRLVAFNGDRRRLGPAERFLTQLVSLPKYARE